MLLARAQRGRYNCVQLLPGKDGTMKYLRRYAWAGATCLVFAAVGASSTSAQKPDTKEPRPDAQRPKVSLKAQPMIAISPARVVLTAELQGGANDYEEYYCPTVVWAWGDGTESENS